jgi:hypothetical protein
MQTSFVSILEAWSAGMQGLREAAIPESGAAMASKRNQCRERTGMDQVSERLGEC